MNLTARKRKYLYRLGNAVVGVLALYGVLSDQEVLAVTLVLAPILGLADRKAID